MILLNRGQSLEFRFFFTVDGLLYDPTVADTPVDIVAVVYRGDTAVGPVVDGPFSYFNQPATPVDSPFFEKVGNKNFIFRYNVPNNFFEGVYSIVVQTSSGNINLSKEFQFQVRKAPVTLSPSVSTSPKSTVINYKPNYRDLDKGNTNTILLMGHADGIGVNNVTRISSVQQAVDLMQADLSSPLLRGFFDAYSSGARDILVCPVAPMSEYVANVAERNVPTDIFSDEEGEELKTFYQKYYERLQDSYQIAESLEFVDIIVPLETSFIQTGDVDFLGQLVEYCSNFHNETGYVQIGVIGSRSTKVREDDIEEMLAKEVLSDKYTVFFSSGEIAADPGRYVVPVYGELIFRHPHMKETYISAAPAAVAGMMATQPLNQGIVRQRIPGALSLYGVDMSQSQQAALDSMGINTLYRGKKARQAAPYEVYMSNDYTLASRGSIFKKLPHVRIVAAFVSEVKSYEQWAIGKFGFEKVVDKFKQFLAAMKNSNIIRDYTFTVEIDEFVYGKIYFNVNLISTFSLEEIQLSLAAGPNA